MRLTIVGIGIVVLVLLASIATAAPVAPHRFRGALTINGNPAPDDVIVEAKIDGQSVAASTTLHGQYGMQTANRLDVPDPQGNRDGKLIEFWVLGHKVGEYTFTSGLSTWLDLSVSGVVVCGDQVCSTGESHASCPGDCAAPQNDGSGGGSGGGGGGGTTTTTEIPQTPVVRNPVVETTTPGVCVPDWVCSDWLDCMHSQRKRVCVDANKCGNDQEKPALVEACVSEPETEAGPKATLATTSDDSKTTQPRSNPFGFLTGTIIKGGTVTYGAIVFLALLTAGVVAIALVSKKKR